MSDPRKNGATPGPQYNPGYRLDKKKPLKYTFGHKRDIKGSAPLKLMISTPHGVGPGLYQVHKKIGVKSNHKNKPKYSMPKDPRFNLILRKYEHHETYDTTRACGFQANSRKRTYPAIAFGKASRGFAFNILH